MRHFSFDSELEHIGEGLVACTLPKAEWTHAAHFAAAFWLMSKSDGDTFARMPMLIRAYNEATGTPNTDTSGYHETITLASLRVTRAWLNTHRHLDLHSALNALLASEYGRSDWLLGYWSKSLLFSVTARRSWIEPDLRDLPLGEDSGSSG